MLQLTILLSLLSLLASTLAAAVPTVSHGSPLARRQTIHARANAPTKFGRDDGCTDVIKPKVFIISMFTPEGDIWTNSNLGLYAVNVTVPSFSPLFPAAHCTKNGEICQLITGEGEINAASTITALVLSKYFDLTTTYFMIAGIAGVSPYEGTLGSVAISRYAVQFALEYEFDARQIPSNFSSGYIPLGGKIPSDYPLYLYGSEVFELNAALRDRAIYINRHRKLNDSDTAIEYRQRYNFSPANKLPTVIACDTGTSDAFWHGSLLSESFGNYTKLLTNGTGSYCMTAQEDNASIEAFLRAALFGAVDFSRIILMRSAANFDRAPPGESETYSFFNDNSGGFLPSLENLYITGRPIIDDITQNWNRVYKNGVKYAPKNYIGDVLESLKSPYPMDIGSVYHQEG